MYAAGKIPGGFFKREGRPTEKAILTARMIDRPIRPLWPKGFTNEVQVICTTLSADLITPHDILCHQRRLRGSDDLAAPLHGPVGAVRIGLIDDELVINPTSPKLEEESKLDLIVVGTKDGLTMVEAGAEEVPEELLLEALELAHAEIKKLCEAQEELRREVGKPKWIDPEVTPRSAGHADRIRERIAAEGLREARRGHRGDRGRAGPAAHDGLHRGGHRPRDAGALEPRHAARAASPRGGRRACPRAVRRRASRADRGRAGLEAAQIREAAPALRPDHRGAPSSRSRSARRPSRARPPRSRTASRSSS